MSLSLYPLHEPGCSYSIQDRFQFLLAHGQSPAAACDRLNQLLEDDRIVKSPDLIQTPVWCCAKTTASL